MDTSEAADVKNWTVRGPVPPVTSAGLQPVGAQVLVMHSDQISMFVDEVAWLADKFIRIVGKRVVGARWLVRLDSRRAKISSSL